LKFGTNVYNFTQYGNDTPGLIEFVRSADELGFHNMRFLDHVIGIVAEKHGGIAQTPYTNKSHIHEIFTLIAHLAALTQRLQFVTGVLVPTQRETCLVAKQAAEIDILSGGRLRLGMGVGYNPVEFECLGADFKTRGRRFEEQVAVMRALWTCEEVTFKGQWHSIRDASLAPLPLQRPIPIWFGMGRMTAPIPSDTILNRVGRLADGWLPMFQPGAEARETIRKVHNAARAAGRDPAQIGMDVSLVVQDKSSAKLRDEIKAFAELGATHVNAYFPPSSAKGEIEAMKRFQGEVICNA
jgi:probable F420-dependent oxidoreductase